MRKDMAEEITRELLSCSGKLDRSVGLLQGVVDEEFFTRYRGLVGQVMGMLYIEILRDLFRQYPELEPESMK
jgi:hypothetical protein